MFSSFSLLFIETQGEQFEGDHAFLKGFGKRFPRIEMSGRSQPNESSLDGFFKECAESPSQVRRTLKLVDPKGRRVVSEKRVGIVLREVERLKVIEADVPAFARKALKEHLLSYPSHAGDQKALVTGVDLVEDLLQGSRKIVGVQ